MKVAPTYHGFIAGLMLTISALGIVWRVRQDPWPALAHALHQTESGRAQRTLVVITEPRFATEIRHFEGLPALAASQIRRQDVEGAHRVWLIWRAEGKQNNEENAASNAITATLRQDFEKAGDVLEVKQLRAALWTRNEGGSQ